MRKEANQEDNFQKSGRGWVKGRIGEQKKNKEWIIMRISVLRGLWLKTHLWSMLGGSADCLSEYLWYLRHLKKLDIFSLSSKPEKNLWLTLLKFISIGERVENKNKISNRLMSYILWIEVPLTFMYFSYESLPNSLGRKDPFTGSLDIRSHWRMNSLQFCVLCHWI